MANYICTAQVVNRCCLVSKIFSNHSNDVHVLIVTMRCDYNLIVESQSRSLNHFNNVLTMSKIWPPALSQAMIQEQHKPISYQL